MLVCHVKHWQSKLVIQSISVRGITLGCPTGDVRKGENIENGE